MGESLRIMTQAVGDICQHLVRFTLSDEQDVDAICYQCGGRCGDHCILEDRAGRCSLKRTGGN